MGEKKYTFSECISHCGYHDLPDGIERFFELYDDSYQQEIIDQNFLSDILTKYNVPITKTKLIQNAIKEIESDSILCYFTKFLIWDMCLAKKRYEANDYTNLFPTCLPQYREYYPFLLLLACVKPSMQLLEKRGIPEVYYADIPYQPMEKQFEKWVLRDDITVSDFPWDMNFYTCSIFLLGRFQFIPCRFEDGFTVYRNHNNNSVIALQQEGVEFRRDGQVNGTNEIYDEKGKFVSQWEENNLTIKANPINPMGYVEQEVVTLHKTDWEIALREGDILLAFHIPEGPGYEAHRVKSSMEEAIHFYRTYFPELDIKGFWSESWLYDSRLSLIMEYEKSNIVKVQRQFYRYPTIESDEMLLSRVFGDKNVDLTKVICRTKLQEAVINYMNTNARFNSLSMFVLKDEVAQIGDCPYLSRKDVEKFMAVVDSHLA